MRSLIEWFAKNHVAVNMLTLFLIVAGLASIVRTNKEVIPDIDLDWVTIAIAYPGASPSDIEEAVCKKIETAIHDVDGIKKVSSNASEHFGTVFIEAKYNADSRKLYDEIKTRVDALQFPPNALRPVIRQTRLRNIVAKLAVHGPADPESLKNIAEQVKKDLVALPGISQVELEGVRPYEISIEASEADLQRYNMSLLELADAIHKSSADLPGGVIKTEAGNVALVAQGQMYWGDQFEQIIVRSEADGGRVLVGDVAHVHDGFADGVNEIKFNGEPAILLKIFQAGGEDILNISNHLNSYIANPTTPVPEGINLTITQDSSQLFKSRMNLLLTNAWQGLLLVFFMILMMMRFRFAIFVVIGIPVSFMGTVMLLDYLGVSINMISLFGFVLVEGLVADDAIVISDNVYQRMKMGEDAFAATINAVMEVFVPVILSSVTMMIAFSPLLFLSGAEGQLIREIPIVVVVTLFWSLIEALFCLPSHLAKININEEHSFPLERWLDKVQYYLDYWLDFYLEKYHRPLLEKALEWRYWVLSLFVSILMITVGLLATGWIKAHLTSEIEADQAIAFATFVPGTSKKSLKSGLDQIEHAAFELKTELKKQTGQDVLQSITTNYGSLFGVIEGDNYGSVAIELTPAENRAISALDVAKQWREKVGDVSDISELKYEATVTKPGPPIDLQISGTDLKSMNYAADSLKKKLTEYTGVYGITDTLSQGKQQIHLRLKPLARDLGMTLDELAIQVRTAFYGQEIQTIQRGEDEVKVIVRYPTKERNELWSLENMNVFLRGDYTSIPLSTVADVEFAESPSEIVREDGKRVVTVSAYVDENFTTSNKVLDDLKKDFLPRLMNNLPGLSWAPSGQQQHEDELIQHITISAVIALMAMYILLAVAFKSYSQPLMVMSAIPFGLVGAILGHLIMGYEVTIWSIVGIIAVSGIVVNTNVVLVDFVNHARESGMPLRIAIRESGIRRFRAVVLSSICNFVGISSMMYETSFQGKFLVPMAISIGWGVLFSAFICIFLIPALYNVNEDIKQSFKKLISYITNTNTASKQDPATGILVTADDAHVGWDNDMNTAYEKGYQDGLTGRIGRKAPYDIEVLAASWEAGWDDGHAEFVEKE